MKSAVEKSLHRRRKKLKENSWPTPSCTISSCKSTSKHMMTFRISLMSRFSTCMKQEVTAAQKRRLQCSKDNRSSDMARGKHHMMHGEQVQEIVHPGENDDSLSCHHLANFGSGLPFDTGTAASSACLSWQGQSYGERTRSRWRSGTA